MTPEADGDAGPSLPLPGAVDVVDVTARDGLQTLAEPVPTARKLALIGDLVLAGVRRLEITSFVRADVVPQFADADALCAALERRPGVRYRALVPNPRGAERAAAAGLDEWLGLMTVSDTYNLKNQNRTTAAVVDDLGRVAERARDAGAAVVLAVGLARWCPYEGRIPHATTLGWIERALAATGAAELYLSTSTGIDDPAETHRLVALVGARFPGVVVGLHLHDGNGQALACALAGLLAGARVVEGSLNGLGGGLRMPSGMALRGNAATEDLVQMLGDMGVATGIELAALVEVVRRHVPALGVPLASSAARGGTRGEVLRAGRV